MKKEDYEQIIETAWTRALGYAARNALTEYFNGRIAIERSDYKKERLLSFPTTKKSCLFSKKSRPTQIKYIRLMHKLGVCKPYFSDADTHISFFDIDTTEILEFIRNYWLNKGIPFNDFQGNKVKTIKKPENFSELMNQLEGLLFNKFPIPAEILNKLNLQGEKKMKRKIFHTPHGRLMLKITSMYRNKYESRFVMTFKPELIVDFASGCTQKIGGKYKNRKMLEKDFKKFDQSQAEKLAKNLYEDLPSALKK